MKQHMTEWIWLDASQTVDSFELSRITGLSTADLEELVEYGALVPLPLTQQGSTFSAAVVAPVRTVARLRAAYDLDVFTAGLLLGYLDRIDALERQLTSLRTHALSIA